LFLSLFLAGCGGAGSSTSSISDTPASKVVITPISEVQGNGNVSPIDGQSVVVAGVVTGDFQDDDVDDTRNLGGFFIQAETPDTDPATSDGIFVFDGNNPAVNVSIGQNVQIAGTVVERFGETQVAASTVTVTGTGTYQAAKLVFPVVTRLNSDGKVIADLERFEGMLVELAESFYVTETYNLERYGEISLSHAGRLQQFTNDNEPDVAAFADYQRQIAGRTLILDDGLSMQNPAASRYLHAKLPGVADYTLRIGDKVSVVRGNIRYSRGSGGSGTEAYRLEPTADPVFVAVNVRSATPPQVGGDVTIASLNVLNYFTTIDEGKATCGPAGNADCRGADSKAEFERQKMKIINALLALDADVVGLIELENNGGESLESIVGELNAHSGAGTWDFIATGIVGTDAITVGLIYRTAAVKPAGDFAILSYSVDSRFNDQKNRPTLAQTFDAAAGGRFTVALNHLKSKGSDCDDVGDPNRNDGQGECNGTRTRAAKALGDWLNSDPTGSNDPDILIIGDLNAYLQEDPLAALEDTGFVNLVKSADGSYAYSYQFDGRAGAMDHAFASRALSSKVSGAAEWHINADEPPLIDYNLDFGRDAGFFDGSAPFRASDHDPVIVGINP
jgi:predicted extracellular nuclease